MLDQKLTEKHCVPCRGGLPPLEKALVQKYLEEISGWTLLDNDTKITRVFTFDTFKDALSFTNRVGALAETENHHPVIELSWGKVRVTLWTHAIGGLHENDFVLAAKIEQLL